MSVIQFISAFGLGAIVSALIQGWMTHRAYVARRDFEEKKEAYTGYLDALHASEIRKTEEAALSVGHWANRVQLVGSKRVIDCCERIRSTNPLKDHAHPDRPEAFSALKDAMRKDLGVAGL